MGNRRPPSGVAMAIKIRERRKLSKLFPLSLFITIVCLFLYRQVFLNRDNNWLQITTVGHHQSFAKFLSPVTAANYETNHSIASAIRIPEHPDELISTNVLEWASPHFNALFRNHFNNSNERDLLSSESIIPYYVYPSEVIFSNSSYYIEFLRGQDLCRHPQFVLPPEHCADITYEIAILNALLDHPHRVTTMNEAKLVVIPVSFGAISHNKALSTSDIKAMLDEIWNHLKVQTPFVKGKPHVIVSMTYDLFASYQSWWRKRFFHQQGFYRFYKHVQQVSVARGDDLLATHYIHLHNVTSSGDNNFRGFEELFKLERPTTEYTFSVGMGGLTTHILLRIPTMKTFQTSPNFIFYRTRETASGGESTSYRFAPLTNVSWSDFPPSSVGHDLPRDQWAQQFSDSKFCLVIRGDNPGSHALVSSIKAGCIPVVISDWFLLYAPPFPASLDVRTFSVVIPEEDFLKSPHDALRSLQDLPVKVIESKLEELAWAQRVTLWDHPESLFVPAFTREAMLSFSRPASELLKKK